MWHVSSRSGVATLRIAIHLLLSYLLTYLLPTRLLAVSNGNENDNYWTVRDRGVRHLANDVILVE